MEILSVGPSVGLFSYLNIAAAMAAASPGDTIDLQSGYSNEAATVTQSGITVTGAANSLGIVLTIATGVTGLTIGGEAPINIVDNAENNAIIGNSGNNVIAVALGVDVVTGGPGSDRLIIDYRNGGVVTGTSASGFTAADGRSVTTNDSIEHFTVLTGSGADTLVTGAGDDVINADDGANTIVAGDGDNLVTTGSGVDTITTGSGNDTINAGDGASTIVAGAGDNIITTGIGVATITFLDDDNIVNVGDGASTVTGGGGANTITTGSGADTITLGDGDNRVEAGDGANTITTGGGNDTAHGGAGIDTITTGGGSDYIYADTGGADVIDGGESVGDHDILDLRYLLGNYTIHYSPNPENGSVDRLDASGRVLSSFTFSNVETIIGGSGADILTLAAAATAGRFDLGAGADTLIFGDFTNSATVSNVETIIGGSGADTLTLAAAATAGRFDLGAGADTLIFGDFTNAATVSNVETIIGGSGADTLTLAAAATAGRFDLGAGADTLIFGDFTNSATVSNVETIIGGSGADAIVNLGSTATTIFGGAGNDRFTGGDGADTAIFTGPFSSYSVRYSSETATFTISGGADGVDTITGVEFFRFGDVTKTAGELIGGGALNPTVSIAAVRSTIAEGDSGTNLNVFTVSLSSAAAAIQTVNYTVSGWGSAQTSDDDFSGALSGVLSFGVGETSKTVEVVVRGDTIVEQHEAFAVTLWGATPALTLGTSRALATIINDDSSYALTASSAFVNEGATATFTLMTTNVAAGTQVAYTLSGISAADVQGGSLSGDLTVGSNGLTTISVALLADSLTEGAETLGVTAAGQTASMIVNDTSQGSSNDLNGTNGNDTFIITSGSNSIDGGAGSDAVQYQTIRSAASVTYSNGVTTVRKANGTDTLTGMESVGFTDGHLVFDVNSANAPAAYRLYGGAFDRTPDEGGFRFWTTSLDARESIHDVAALFISSPEFIARYGSGLSNEGFVDALYHNVLGREGETGGLAHWNRMLDNKYQDRADVLVEFTQLPEYVGISQADIKDGYWVL